MPDFPRSLIEFQHLFTDDAACAAHLAAARWPEGFVCPACSHTKAWQLETETWTFECAGCRRQTSVIAGTLMHSSKLALSVWFWAAYLMTTHSNGISALQPQKQLGLSSYKTAWLLCAKLRRAMVASNRAVLSGLLEVDEIEIVCRSKDDPRNAGSGRSRRRKMPVAGAVEVQGAYVPGRIGLIAINDYSAKTLHAVIQNNIAAGATVKTDGWAAYPRAPRVNHEPHVIGPMAAHIVLPWTHRVFSNLKTWALGVYHGLRCRHLQSYLDEFVFRLNRWRTRHAAFRSLLGISVKIGPVTCNMLIAPKPQG